MGGHVNIDTSSIRGNVINIPSNEYAELNMFLDPVAAKTVLYYGHNITIIPLGVQRKVSQFAKILESLQLTKKTPEALFARRLISRLHSLHRTHPSYQHVVPKKTSPTSVDPTHPLIKILDLLSCS